MTAAVTTTRCQKLGGAYKGVCLLGGVPTRWGVCLLLVVCLLERCLPTEGEGVPTKGCVY